MARGKQQRKDLKAFSYKIKTKDLPKPEFVESERQGDKFVELPERQYTLKGTLTGVEPKEFKWEGKVIKSVNVTLTDDALDEIYFITVPYSNLGRGLMNSLLGLKQFNDVEVSLYQTKPKTDGGKTYPAVSLRQDGEMVRWAYDLKDLPAPKVVEFKGQKQYDFLEQEVFFATKLTEFNKIVKAAAPARTAEVPVPATPADTDDENIPF